MEEGEKCLCSGICFPPRGLCPVDRKLDGCGCRCISLRLRQHTSPLILKKWESVYLERIYFSWTLKQLFILPFAEGGAFQPGSTGACFFALWLAEEICKMQEERERQKQNLDSANLQHTKSPVFYVRCILSINLH